MNVEDLKRLMAVLEIPEDKVSFSGYRDESVVCYRDPDTGRWNVGYHERGRPDREDIESESEAVSWLLDHFGSYFDNDGFFGGWARAFTAIDDRRLRLPNGSIVGVTDPRNQIVIPIDVPDCSPGRWADGQGVQYVVKKPDLIATRRRASSWFSKEPGDVLRMVVFPWVAVERGSLVEVEL